MMIFINMVIEKYVFCGYVNRKHDFIVARFSFLQACEEVKGFLTSPFPSSVFSDLSKALDVKCQAITKLSALLKDLTDGK